MTIYCDDRDFAPLIAQLKELTPDVEVKRLDIGDYIIGDFAIERKELCDLLGSIYDGRYWNQIRVLKETYPKPCVLIEGNVNNSYKSSKRGGKLWKHLLNETDVKTIRSVENATLLKWGIPFIESEDYIDSAKRIYELHEKYVAEKATTPPRSVVPKEVKPEKVRFAMLQTIEGLGPMGATRILNKYKFSELCMIGDSNELCKNVVGLNRKIADRVVKVFHDE